MPISFPSRYTLAPAGRDSTLSAATDCPGLEDVDGAAAARRARASAIVSDCAGLAAETTTRRWSATYPSRTTRTVCAPRATPRTVSGVSPTSRPSSTTRAPAGVDRTRSRPAAAGADTAFARRQAVAPRSRHSASATPGYGRQGSLPQTGSRTALSVNSRTERPLVACASGRDGAAAATSSGWRCPLATS